MSADKGVNAGDEVDTSELEDEDETAGQGTYLSMSDEELLKAGPPTLVIEDKPAKAADTTTDTTKPADDADKGAADAARDSATKEKAAAAAAEDDEDDQKDPPAPKTKVEDKPKDDKAKPAKVDEKADETKVEPTAIDYKAAYEQLLGTFKANGKDIKVDSVEDARALMQMGANYSKKMAGLKPSLKLMKMLETSGFLSEEKLGYLIDLGKKDPAAINKLVKESGIDPMDLTAEKGEAYKRTTFAADDREIDLDTVLDDLKESPTYTRTLDVVGKKWDVASKQVVSGNPQLLRVINDHMASGIYDRISTEVEKERMLGRLNGVSDIDAYKAMGDSIDKRGGFDDLLKKQAATPPAPVIVAPPAKKVDDDKLNDKRRAASSTKPAAPNSAPAGDFNPLAMSDEDFSKMAKQRFK